MNILIIENEKPAADKIKHLLKQIDPGIEVVGISESVEEAVNWLQSMSLPDLMLIDIQLDDGLCFEIFETIQVDIPVIFTTAYNEYVLRAFKLNSVDYLLKPIQESELRIAINKFKTVHYTLFGDKFKQIFAEFKNKYKTRFLIRIGSHYKSIPTNEIACFHIAERAVFIKVFDGQDFAIDYSLDHLQKILDPEKFFRINRNCMISINAIGDILRFSTSRLKLKLDIKTNSVEDDSLIVSRDKVQKFKKWIDR